MTVALLAATALTLPGIALPGTQRLLPDVGPPIERVVVAVNSARRSALRNAPLVAGIVNGLPARTKVIILANDPEAFVVLSNPWPERIRFVTLPYANPLTIWTQDPFLVLQDEDGVVTLLASREFGRADDRLMAAALAEEAGYRIRTSELHFEGGNIVADRESVFIGANTIRHNAAELEISELEVAVQFEQELGRRVVVIGPVPQPVAHIDMVLTPIGSGEVVLADPAEGARIVAAALAADPASVAEFERNCETRFFGDPAITELAGKDRRTISPPQLDGRAAEMAQVSRSIAPVFDGIAAALVRYGYRVHRVPFLFGGPESTGVAAGEDSMRAGFPMLTYNNVLLEEEDGRRTVYLPRYGWQAMDDAARAAWEALGFATRQIDGLETSAMYGGALRCAVKVLERAVEAQSTRH